MSLSHSIELLAVILLSSSFNLQPFSLKKNNSERGTCHHPGACSYQIRAWCKSTSVKHGENDTHRLEMELFFLLGSSTKTMYRIAFAFVHHCVFSPFLFDCTFVFDLCSPFVLPIDLKGKQETNNYSQITRYVESVLCLV